MKLGQFAASLALGASLIASAATAQDFKPAVVFDMGGKFDKSFNENAYNAAEKFKAETGIAYREFEVTNEAQREQALRRMARDGASIVVSMGFAQATPLEKVSQEFPDTRFCIVDATVDQPNVRSYVTKDHEGSFLVGMLAAMKSETGAVGFIGGMDIPLIRNFLTGYEQGAKHVNPDVRILVNMTGDTPAAWNDPTRGAELARSQFDRGADVVFAAAGATGLGVIKAAADEGKFAVGVDSNQNGEAPGHVLTSMLKRVDVAVHDCLTDAKDGNWTPGKVVLGIAEDGVGYAVDENNKDLLTEDMLAKVEQARQDIVAGKIVVAPLEGYDP